MRNLWLVACVLGPTTIAHAAEEAREMEVDKLHEAEGTVSRQLLCTYAAARAGRGFSQSASASVSGNRSLESLLDDACKQCAANNLPCKLEKLVLAEVDSKTKERVDSDVILDKDVDTSCPRKNDRAARVANGARAKLKVIPPKPQVAQQPAAPTPAFPGFPPGFGPPPVLFQPPAWFFEGGDAFGAFHAQQQEAFRWYHHGMAPHWPRRP